MPQFLLGLDNENEPNFVRMQMQEKSNIARVEFTPIQALDLAKQLSENAIKCLKAEKRRRQFGIIVPNSIQEN